ncbi:hypothetical protein ACTMTU_08065 [Streptomyces sp. OZ13]|uniref:hypothetical protein n=1 Tax=Streptomyces sp. OZ13 TaxID=3452210 RepID=UPI003F8B0728
MTVVVPVIRQTSGPEEVPVGEADLVGMTSQIITLVGVLSGALLSFVVTHWAERTKFRQTLATRRDERKLDACIQYTSCVKEEVRTARQAVEACERGDDNTEALAEMEAAEAKRSVLFEGLILLSDDTAADAARAVNERTWNLLERARRPGPGPEMGARQRELSNFVIEALNVLHLAARRDLAMHNRSAALGRRQTRAL